MKYNAPYGVSDPNAPYINGNPSTGTMGSIPPAASIEYPQREIVNIIEATALAAPDNADLHQLAKAIQSQKLWSVDDAGTANQYNVTLAQHPGAYYRYMLIVAYTTAPNTGPSNLNVNAMGAKPVVRADGSELVPGDIGANTLNAFMYDGAKFRIVWGAKSAGATGWLTQNLTFYVNYATGSDANDGAAAVLAAGHGPFKTLQKAADVIGTFNLNGYNVTVNVADSPNYASVRLPASAGNGSINWIGNAGNPANVVITGTNTIAVSVGGVNNTMNGFKVQTTGGTGQSDTRAGIHAQGAVAAIFQNMEWGACAGPHNFAYGGAYVRLGGTLKISGSAQNHVYGNGAFIICVYGAKVDFIGVGASPITLVGTPNWPAAFVMTDSVGVVFFTYSTLTGLGTGKKYQGTFNSVISVGGGGINYLPGDSAGTVATGAQYA
jgi:hypothetical protein